MKSKAYVWARCVLGGVVLLGLGTSLLAGSPGGEKQRFDVAGTFVEGCSCSMVCRCNMGQMGHGCQGVGAMVIMSGSYKGVDLGGAKMAYGVAPGSWVRIYTEAKDASQQEALRAFLRAAFSPLGKVEEVKTAKIELTGDGGKYTLKVDGGRIMSLTTEPVLGADQKTPFSYHNTLMPLSPTILPGQDAQGQLQRRGSLVHAGRQQFLLQSSRQRQRRIVKLTRRARASAGSRSRRSARTP